MDLAISATPIADRCIKSSTQPCNLHRQTLAVEWPILSDFQRGTVIGCLLSNKSVRQNSALLERYRSTLSAVILKWKCLGATTAQPRGGRPHKLTERRVLKRVAPKNQLSSAATLTTKFQTASVKTVSTRTVRSEFHEMCFHVRAAAQKPKITMCNVKRMEWCKAYCHWTLEKWKRILWSDESRFTIWQTDRCQENATCPNA